MPGPSWLTSWGRMNTKQLLRKDSNRLTLKDDDSGKASHTTEGTADDSLMEEAEIPSTHRRCADRRDVRNNSSPSSSPFSRGKKFVAAKAPASPATSASESSAVGIGGLFPHQFFSGELPHPECVHCARMEQKLVSALDDLDYVRKVASEKSEEVKSDKKPETKAKVPSLDFASKQLREATTRHQKQVEQLTKDGMRWQREMHLKLHKYVALCENLNEESATLNSECCHLREDVVRVDSERNDLAKEVLILRAQAAEHERERIRFSEIEARMLQLEHDNLEAQRAIATQDAVMEELTVQLEHALDQLEQVPQEQHPKKRHGFFPLGF